jgi:cobalamin biosynthesis Mg chelatase CobN
VLLPACGGNAVKSSDSSATMMVPEAPTPETSVKSSAVPANSYVEKTSSKSKTTTAKTVTTSTVPMASAPTPLPTIATTPAVETTAVAQKSGSHFLWWLLLILILAGIGWYFWSKNHSDEDEFQPHPPSGGLSPVSGYTGTRDLAAEEKKAPSLWTRKLF